MMGIMIEDPEIIESLEKLAALQGTTKAQALLNAMRALEASTDPALKRGPLFPRDRVTYRTYRI